MRQPVLSMISGLGLFWEMRYKSFAEAGVNLIVSLVLLMQTSLGVNAVIIGTILSNLLVNTIWEPVILFRKGVKIKPTAYIKNYIGYSVYLYISLGMSAVVAQHFTVLGVLKSIVISVIVATASMLGLVLFSYRSKSFRILGDWVLKK